jgi:hypothetical protein
MVNLLQLESNRDAEAYEKLYPKGKPKRNFRIVDRKLFITAMATLKGVVTFYDGVCKITGMKNRIRKVTDIVNTTMKLAITFSFYASPRYVFHNHNLMDLTSRVSPADTSVFPVDARAIEWERYMGPIHLSGLNRYALKARKTAIQQAEDTIRITGVAEIPAVGGTLESGTV